MISQLSEGVSEVRRAESPPPDPLAAKGRGREGLGTPPPP